MVSQMSAVTDQFISTVLHRYSNIITDIMLKQLSLKAQYLKFQIIITHFICTMSAQWDMITQKTKPRLDENVIHLVNDTSGWNISTIEDAKSLFWNLSTVQFNIQGEIEGVLHPKNDFWQFLSYRLLCCDAMWWQKDKISSLFDRLDEMYLCTL